MQVIAAYCLQQVVINAVQLRGDARGRANELREPYNAFLELKVGGATSDDFLHTLREVLNHPGMKKRRSGPVRRKIN
jgi:hypothetical protein